jgi:hypothetical protein
MPGIFVPFVANTAVVRSATRVFMPRVLSEGALGLGWLNCVRAMPEHDCFIDAII